MKYRYDGQKTSLVVYKEALISYSGKAKKAEDKTPDLIVILTEPSKMIERSTEAVCDTKVRALFWAAWESDTWDEEVWGMLLKILASQCLKKKIRQDGVAHAKPHMSKSKLS